MMLWQKIFLCTLVIVMTAVSSISIIILKNNHDTSIERQITNSLAEHSYLKSNIKNRIVSERLEQNVIVLSEAQILEVLEDTTSVTDNQERTTIAIYDTKGNILLNHITIPVNDNLYHQVQSTKQVHRLISQQNGEYYLLIGSTISLEHQDYIMMTASNISELYRVYQTQLDFTEWFSISVSLVSALVLLIVIKILLMPLAKLNKATRQIASGDYANRIRVHGSNELSNLANNMNTMADSIEHHINLLTEAAENRKQFIHNLTHEMKTPLTSILGFADLLRIKTDISPAEVSEYSDIIFEEAKRLKSLSGKLMELITVGETTTEFETISSIELFEQIQRVLKPILKKNNITLITECDDFSFQADGELFKSMIYNLIDNAMKASKSGDTIFFTGTKDTDFKITVKDQGIGIPKEELKKVMEPFYMVDKARSRQAGGAGLGLALCKRIAEIHHADFAIDSTLGTGTIVSITLKGKHKHES